MRTILRIGFSGCFNALALFRQRRSIRIYHQLVCREWQSALTPIVFNFSILKSRRQAGGGVMHSLLHVCLFPVSFAMNPNAMACWLQAPIVNFSHFGMVLT